MSFWEYVSPEELIQAAITEFEDAIEWYHDVQNGKYKGVNLPQKKISDDILDLKERIVLFQEALNKIKGES